MIPTLNSRLRSWGWSGAVVPSRHSIRGFSAPARVRSAFEDIVAYVTPELVVFAGRERGTYAPDGGGDAKVAERPEIHTTCICAFRYIAEQGGWRQVLHVVAFDDAEQLARFQRTVRGV